MFDSYSPGNSATALTAVRRYFFDFGHELADAASLLGGPAAEAQVVSCGLYLETVGRIDCRIRRDLAAIHRLLALENVGDPDRIETELFVMIDPASRQVETICLLTDKMEELLRAIKNDEVAGPRNRSLAA